MRNAVSIVAIGALLGCMRADGILSKPTKPKEGIIGKKTQKIGEFKPEAGLQPHTTPYKFDDPVLYGAQAYRPAIEQISKMSIQRAVNLFHAEHNRYPKDYQEFMDKIIKANGIELPELGSRFEYQYDVKKHELVIVQKASEPSGQKR
jgi:hypothetical protein